MTCGNRPSRRGLTFLAALTAVVALGCGSADLEQVAKAGRLVLDTGGSEVEIALERLDIFLVDDDYASRYPDDFVLMGDGLVLPGAMPTDVRVGYEEDFEHALYRTLDIKASYSPGGEGPFQAHITLLGEGKLRVEGGSIRIVEVLGTNPAGAGTAVRAEVRLRVAGHEPLEGMAEVLAVTWG